jgi:glycosyltransferase involved in cell wall biosynthesis
VASSVAGELGEYGINPQAVEVLGNGVNTTLFWPAEPRQPVKPSAAYVLAVGRLDLRKGFEDLIAAMPQVVSRFPETRLCIAGIGPLEAQLRRQTASLKLDEVIQFLGHVDHARLVGLYQRAALFAHAAHYEGLPTVLLEAMACGKAVASTAVSGALDVVEDGVNGLLVPAQSPEALADGIGKLLGDPELRARLGRAARRTVQDRFSWQTVGAAYLRCYQALLEDNNR